MEIKAASAVFGFLLHGVPVLIGLGFVRRAHLGRRNSHWIAVGLVALIIASALADFGIRPTNPPAPGLTVWVKLAERSASGIGSMAVQAGLAMLAIVPALVWSRRILRITGASHVAA
jgi:hypothetical protein